MSNTDQPILINGESEPSKPGQPVEAIIRLDNGGWRLKILTAVISKPLYWSFIGILAICAFTGSIRPEDRHNIWLAGADSNHQQRLEQMVAKLKDGQVVSDHSECWFGIGLMLVQKELNDYVNQGELAKTSRNNCIACSVFPFFANESAFRITWSSFILITAK